MSASEKNQLPRGPVPDLGQFITRRLAQLEPVGAHMACRAFRNNAPLPAVWVSTLRMAGELYTRVELRVGGYDGKTVEIEHFEGDLSIRDAAVQFWGLGAY